jgi:hypothetical protein
MKIRIVILLVLFWVIYQFSDNWSNDLGNIAKNMAPKDPDYQAYTPPDKP